MTWLWVTLVTALVAFFSWRLSRVHLKCSIHAQLNADLLTQMSHACSLLPIDPRGALLVLRRGDQLARDAADELEREGLWGSR